MKRDKSAAVGLVICFVAMIAIVGAITFSNYERKQEEELARTEEEQKEKEPSQVTQGDDIQAEIEEKPEVVLPEIDYIEPSVELPKLSFSTADRLTWPVDGNVLMNYSMDKTIYFATLDQYKYNPALIIQGEVGEEVWSAEEGEVTSIKTDAQTGTTVTVNLGDGYEAVYGQLKDVAVKEGQRIDKGELIGHLAEPTKYYSVEGANLYFELLKDGKPINPLEYLDV